MVLREGMRPMKSFGVRLAAGAGTILVVAYAIALAQKDNQAASDTWNAETAVSSNPAVPIGDQSSPAWLEQPDSELANQQQALAFHGSTEPVDRSKPVAQVNHDQLPDAAPAVAMAGYDEFSGDAARVSDPTSIATPEVSLPTESQLAVELPPIGDGSFSTPQADFQTETTANLALPDSDSTDVIDPAFTPSSEPKQELAASSPDLPSAFGASNPTANALPVAAAALPADTAAAFADSAEAGAAFAAAGMGEFPETDLSTFTNEATVATDANLASTLPADAVLGLPAEPAAEASLVQEIAMNAQIAPLANAAVSIPDPSSAPANTLRGATPTQNQLRSALPDENSTAVAVTGAFAAPNMTPTEPTGFPNPTGLPPAESNFAGDAIQGDSVSASVAAAGPSIMAVSPASTAAIAAPATFETGEALTPNSGYAANPVEMVPPNTAMALTTNATTDAPGERRLEGAQTPSVIIQKRAPAEVKVGKPAAFVINVRNVGSVEALDVEIHDRVPAGMRLADASPAPQIQGNLLMWQIGSMPAGDERTITLQLIPEQEGELGSVARVSFEAAASVRTIATRPVLNIEQQAPEKVLIGQQVEIALELSNTGSGKATNIEIWEDVPPGLSHPEGPQLKQNIGTLMPGEVRTDSLFLKAEKPGTIKNTIRLVGDDGLATEETISIEVIAPRLEVSLQGPSRRFLERQAKYELNVANAGTAAATNVEISVQLSRGFTFVSTDYEGQYDPNRHAVFWSLAQLPAGASGVVPLTLLPIETGEQVLKINANADLSALAQTERKMTVEGFADLSFSITNPKGPIEIGAETTYDIVVENSGSKPDTNIRVQIQLPAGLQLLSVDGDAGTDGNGLVAFQPKAQLAPGQEFKYRVRARGTSAGTHIVKAVVVSDHSPVPVTKEDTTRVYADQ
ncbi:MAG: hypothetical protein CMM07_20640 [Rhodopirellula sp.]|nr:hypothetical protein [Rhodopirellula sp.]